MKNGETNKLSRLSFLRLGLFALFAPLIKACKTTANSIGTQINGANHSLGHRLRTQDFPPITQYLQTDVLIIGGGITGLSACRQLSKKGKTNFVLLEMDTKLGGNSASGENAYTAYPLGAHYLPLPNLHDTELINFLYEEKIILGFDAQGLPIFDEMQLVFDPQERLFINNKWQEGIVPLYGVDANSKAQIATFEQLMDKFKDMKGSDGKYFFDIPLKNCTKDTNLQYLDALTMQQWLTKQQLNSPELLAYIDYCCRDDFGVGIQYVSAWAGIHYYAARKQNATNNNNDMVLTWQEGNGKLVQLLQKYAEQKTLKNHLAYHITYTNNKVKVAVFDAVAQISKEYTANKVILATPQFVNRHLLPNRKIAIEQFHYAPWLAATLTLSQPLNLQGGFPLCWDNVIFKGKGLGYINTLHQSLRQTHNKAIITYYYTFDGQDANVIRQQIYEKPKSYWEAFIIEDLQTAHYEIASLVENIDLTIWGHGMISPMPNFIFSDEKKRAKQNINNLIYFAHTDLSGMSLFEEAFHQGIEVANEVL